MRRAERSTAAAGIEGKNATHHVGNRDCGGDLRDGAGRACRAPRHPEYQRTWEDGALRTNAQKGLKGKTRAQTSGLPTGKRQHKPFSVTKPTDK